MDYEAVSAVQSAHIAAKMADLELGVLHPSHEGARRQSRTRNRGMGPSRRPMRAVTLSHMDSLHEQAALFRDADAGRADTASLRSTASLQSISSQIGTTGYDRCCVGTRIYRRDPKAPLDQSSLVPLEMFLAKASFYSKHILVAAPLNDVNLCTGIEDLLRRCKTNPVGQDFIETELVKIPYWGKFTPPLNILLRHATLNKDRWLLFQSVEVLAEQRAVTTLLSHMDDKTLVVGLALEHSHRFSEGVQPLTGLTCPWNTFAVWNVEKLGRTGFLPISDGVPPLSPEAAGVEELAAIALIQMLFPKNAAAKLVKLHSSLYSWDINFKCEARLALHRKKMQSKLDRPKHQVCICVCVAVPSLFLPPCVHRAKRLPCVMPMLLTAFGNGRDQLGPDFTHRHDEGTPPSLRLDGVGCGQGCGEQLLDRRFQ